MNLIELRKSDLESVYVDPARILFITANPMGVVVVLNVEAAMPLPIEVIDTLDELLILIGARPTCST